MVLGQTELAHSPGSVSSFPPDRRHGRCFIGGMGKRPENVLCAAARLGGRAIISLSRPTLLYDILLDIASRCAPSGQSRRKLARKLRCNASTLPDTLVCYAAIYTLAGLIVLLCLQGLVRMFAD